MLMKVSHYKISLYLFLFFFISPIVSVAQSDPVITAEEKVAIMRYNRIPSNLYINDIFVDKANRIRVSTSGGLYTINNIKDEPVLMLKGMNVIASVVDNKGKVYAATEHVLWIDENQKFIDLKSNQAKISSLAIVNNKVWIGTDQGIMVYHPSTDRIDRINKDNSPLRTNVINFIHQDEMNIIWIGTDKGEYRIEGEKWKSYNEKYNVLSYYENSEGMWFLSAEDMWLVDRYNRQYKVGLEPAMYSGKVNDFAIDSKGRLYVASDKLLRYDPYKEQYEDFEGDAGLVTSKCTRISCDKNDNVWVGTNGTGLYRLAFKDLIATQFNVTLLQQRGVSCYGKADAALKISVSGGKGPYRYEWNDPKLRGNNPTGLAAGEYTVTVSDQIQNKSVSSIIVEQPEPITIALLDAKRVSAPNAKDGILEVTATGGTGKLSYKWSTGDKTATIKRLNAGKYVVSVTDENNCVAEAEFSVQREKFIPELEISKIDVGSVLRINALYFKADSTELSPESFDVLNEILDFLKNNPNVSIEIGGHTNTVPPHEYCDKLSAERARNVAKFFYDNGISQQRVVHKGYGKRQPITLSESVEGRKLNQRVEIKILSK